MGSWWFCIVNVWLTTTSLNLIPNSMYQFEPSNSCFCHRDPARPSPACLLPSGVFDLGVGCPFPQVQTETIPPLPSSQLTQSLGRQPCLHLLAPLPSRRPPTEGRNWGPWAPRQGAALLQARHTARLGNHSLWQGQSTVQRSCVQEWIYLNAERLQQGGCLLNA